MVWGEGEGEMVQSECRATRFVSFVDHPERPVRLSLGEDQEVLQEEQPEHDEDGQLLRFLFVRGPISRPILLIREEQLPDGSKILVRYAPEIDEPCV
jgi:hypothetical protein